jgi:uncharacterized SAM-binding protein YcdF (DUF218 family)
MAKVFDLPTDVHTDAETLWRFHRLDHELAPASVSIGLGSHDLGVATYTAELYHRGLFPVILFSGANAPTTVGRFPRGEAVHYRDHAVSLGVPPEAIYLETKATNTPENITLAHELLDAAGIRVDSAIVTSRPYQQRRAYGIFKKLWPGPDVMCSAEQLPMDKYIAGIGDTKRVVDMLVGDTQRLQLDWQNGWGIEQEIPGQVWAAYERLIAAGFTSRVIKAA